MTASLLTPLLLLLAAATCGHAQLELFSAGPIGSAVSTLTDGDVICPDDYPSGFTIGCAAPLDTDRRAVFFVDGARFRREAAKPFFLAGDRNGVARPWRAAESALPTVVECRLRSATYTASLTISCASTATTPTPAPTATPTASASAVAEPGQISMFFRPVSARQPRVPLVPGMTFCPSADLGTDDFTIECAGTSPGLFRARFRVRGALVQVDREFPFTISDEGVAYTGYPDGEIKFHCGLSDMSRLTVRGVRIECPGGTGGSPPSIAPPVASPTASPVAASGSGGSAFARAGCVVLDTQGVSLSDGWETVSDGVAFKKDDFATSVTSPGAAPIYFTFTPTRSGRHAVVVDLTTSGGSDYNDIWVELAPGGFLLRKPSADGEGTETRRETGWIKAFQKLNGRGANIVSVDFDPHSISSWDSLDAGTQYTFGIGGRSNRVTIHRVIFFVCEGEECLNFRWSQTQEICAPGSFPRRN